MDKIYEILVDGVVTWENIHESKIEQTIHAIKQIEFYKNKLIQRKLMKECPTCHTRLSSEVKV